MVPDPAAPPVDAAPVEPTLVEAAPVEAIAIDPIPGDPALVEPTLVEPTLVDAAPVDAAPVDPTLPMAAPLAPVTPLGHMEPMPPVETTPPDMTPPDMSSVDMAPAMDLAPALESTELSSMPSADEPTSADPTTALPMDPFAVPVEGPDPLAVLRGDPPPDDLGGDGPRPVDPDAARDGIVVDYGDSFPPSSPSTAPSTVWDDPSEPRIAPHTVLDVPPAPLSEAPIDVHDLDAPTDAISDLDAPLGVADYADVFDSAPPEVAALDHTPYGLEIDAEPLPDTMPPAAIVEPEPIVTDPAPEPTVTPEPIVSEATVTPDAEVTAPIDMTAPPVEVDEPAVDTPAAIKWHAPALAIEAPASEVVDDEPQDNGAAHFTKAGPDWQVGGMSPATAMADDGALALRRTEARWALCDVHQAGDFTAEAVVDFTAGTGFGILFRARVDDHDRIDGYSFDVDSVTAGGGYLIRQWEANRPHWRPLAQAHVTDATMLFGRHTITLTVRGDQLTVQIDGETVLTAPSLSRLSVDLGREPARGDRLGVQAGTTTEVTVDRFAAAAI
jgi:hypothetical protein